MMTTTILKMSRNTSVRADLGRLLREAGFGVVEVDDWDAAAQAARQGEPAIVVGDTEVIELARGPGIPDAAPPRDVMRKLSHELRTPLSAMKLMLETVMLSEDDAEARALFLPQIAQEVERMIGLVEDLLELARSEAGVISLRRERFDLTEVASSTVATFAQRADALGIALVLEAPAPVEVDADRARLTQVALNLVDNALRHTPAGGRVTVAVGRDGDEAFLRVRDTGIGIPFGDLPRVFERFYVVDRSRSREHGGTGLGLSIAKHLVEAHGGTLSASSVYGQGATFTMRLTALQPGAEH
jgi:two-component system phosphate regulon sensor histidine kinase PhoR